MVKEMVKIANCTASGYDYRHLIGLDVQMWEWNIKGTEFCMVQDSFGIYHLVADADIKEIE